MPLKNHKRPFPCCASPNLWVALAPASRILAYPLLQNLITLATGFAPSWVDLHVLCGTNTRIFCRCLRALAPIVLLGRRIRDCLQNGARYGSRTRDTCLEGRSFAAKLTLQNGANYGTRTRDLILGKDTYYQLY